MRNAIALLVLVAAAVGLAYFASHLRPNTSTETPIEQAIEDRASKAGKPTAASTGGPQLKTFDEVKAGAVPATLVVENRGTIGLELYPAAAPKTVKHITDLAHKHFYDGILFHRVEPGFVVQAGDPTTKGADGAALAKLPSRGNGYGSSGSGTTVPLEATLPHVANSLGLARSDSEDSGDSQFFINLADSPHLNGKYCVFGRVISGADIVRQIKQGDKISQLSVP